MSATLAMPISALELREVVRTARPYNPSRLDRVLRLDASRALVEVQASAAWAGLADAVGEDWGGLWSHCPAIGEALATNAPGPDGRPAVHYIEALALVTPDGELRQASRDANRELFALAVGGQGLFGAPYSVTLRLESLARAASNALPSASLTLARGYPGRPLQLLLAPPSLQAFLADARLRCEAWRIEIRAIDVRRCMAEDETWLRWARQEYAWVRLELAQPQTLGGTVRTTQLRRELIDVALAHGGSFPVSCTPEATRAQTEACYPQLKGFLAEKRRFDPAGKLDNAWYRHYASLLGREGCESRWNQEAA